MTIESLAKDDVDEVIELAKERNLLHSLDKEVLLKASRNETYRVYVAKDKDIIGYVLIVLEGEEAEIDSVAVRKNFEGKGIGSSLIEYSLKKLKETGVKRVLLEVKKTNTRAINLYAKFGFKPYRIRKGYYDGVDAICMDRGI